MRYRLILAALALAWLPLPAWACDTLGECAPNVTFVCKTGLVPTEIYVSGAPHRTIYIRYGLVGWLGSIEEVAMEDVPLVTLGHERYVALRTTGAMRKRLLTAHLYPFTNELWLGGSTEWGGIQANCERLEGRHLE
jgi:hypothetical protein